jgi:hypothetical protein
MTKRDPHAGASGAARIDASSEIRFEDKVNPMRLSTITIAAGLLVATPALAEEHRELGPHVHGHGNLNIAIEGSKLSMELEAPGMDIVGFEHAAMSDADKATVDKATKLLETPLALFKLPAAAGCKVTEAKVIVEPEHEHGDDDHDHDQDAAEAKDGDHDKDEPGHDEHAGHNQFHVTYALDCAKPAEIASITFDYFQSFAGAHDLTVNVVTAKAQNTYQVNRDKPTVDLGGMM